MNEAPLELLFSVLAALILLSGFFSSSETGMMSLNRYRLKHMRQEGHAGAERASSLLKRPDRLIGLILIGNNLVNIFAASIATIIGIRLMGDAGIAVASILLTLVILIFAEITPKTVAALHPEKVAFPASWILIPLMKLLYPLVWIVNSITNTMLRLCGIDPSNRQDEKVSAEELRTIVGDIGGAARQRQNMLLNILDLEDVSVDHIMVPRNEVEGIDLEADDETILEQLQSLEYTRMPVYEGDINNIIGILHQRKVSRAIGPDGKIQRRQLLNQIREPYFIPEATPLHKQLLNFQKQKRRMGIVVDEYGVVQGIVTLDDILEEIVGDFTSNLAEETDEIYPQQDGSVVIDGSTTIRDINKSLDWDLPTEGPKTLNGLLLEHLESFPEASVGVKIGEYHFEIDTIQDNVIQTAHAWKTEVNG